jgi:hypothetical protein
MKDKWIIGLAFVALIAAIAFSAGFILNINSPDASSVEQLATNHQKNDVAGSYSYQMDLTTSMPANLGKILVYKTIPPDVDKGTTLAFAKKFNVTGTLRGDTVIQSDDLVYGVQLSKNSGSAEYMNANRPNKEMDAPEMLPSDKEAVEIATRFLKERALLPEGAYFSRTEREYARSTDKNGNEIRHYGRIEVWFDRKLNNLEVEGTQLSVTIGGNGDIIEYYTNWRDYSPYKEYPIKSPEAAFEELKKQGIPIGLNKPDTVLIDTVYLAYATKAGAFKEEYLEPVWVFKGEALAKGSPIKNVNEWIPALGEVPAELITT